MAEKRGIEIQPQPPFSGVIHPRLEMLGLQLVPIRPVFRRHNGVAGMQVQPFFPGDQAAGLVEIGSQFFEGSGLSGIIACGLNAAGKGLPGIFQASHIVPLPAVDADRNFLQSGNSCVRIHAPCGIAFSGFLIHTQLSFGIKVFSSKSARIRCRA